MFGLVLALRSRKPAIALVLLAFSTAYAQLTFSTNTYKVGSYPTCVAAADVNGDGKPD